MHFDVKQAIVLGNKIFDISNERRIIVFEKENDNKQNINYILFIQTCIHINVHIINEIYKKKRYILKMIKFWALLFSDGYFVNTIMK